eukprot:TRINITY_DN3510_c0_g1_i1.p1 TRINITY_DN3510_c0_g1~~TRINITY_DN3510_c0_g1_i1.p1  ORF type:complete len:128 (+),score=7.74 TRINITY_DN3510_c0_g1_i1:57-440(+)
MATLMWTWFCSPSQATEDEFEMAAPSVPVARIDEVCPVPPLSPTANLDECVRWFQNHEVKLVLGKTSNYLARESLREENSAFTAGVRHTLEVLGTNGDSLYEEQRKFLLAKFSKIWTALCWLENQEP